ncbi:MAG TPA: hypothetical protein VF767_06700, partial [Bryobacteraceae bacterium]
RAQKKKKKLVEMAGALPRGSAGTLEPSEDPVVAASRDFETRLLEQQAEQARQEAEALNNLRLPTVGTKKAEVLGKHIAEAVKKDPVTTAQILRTWLAEDARR